MNRWMLGGAEAFEMLCDRSSSSGNCGRNQQHRLCVTGAAAGMQQKCEQSTEGLNELFKRVHWIYVAMRGVSHASEAAT